MSAWSNRFIGITGQREDRGWRGTSCAGLVKLVYAEELSIRLPECPVAPIGRERGEQLGRTLAGWPWVKLGSNAVLNAFDLVVIERHGVDDHVGLVASGADMLHVELGQLSRLDEIRDPRWASRISGFYRHIDLAQALRAAA